MNLNLEIFENIIKNNFKENNNNLKFYDWNTFINLSNEEYISPVKNNLNQVVFTLCSYKLLSKEDICYIQFISLFNSVIYFLFLRILSTRSKTYFYNHKKLIIFGESPVFALILVFLRGF